VGPTRVKEEPGDVVVSRTGRSTRVKEEPGDVVGGRTALAYEARNAELGGGLQRGKTYGCLSSGGGKGRLFMRGRGWRHARGKTILDRPFIVALPNPVWVWVPSTGG
jgi:hypothetical protein